MAYADAIQALGDPTRRTVFERLREGPRSVGELAGGLPVSRPAVSQHLRVLERAGLVRARRDGTRNFYSVDGDGLAELRTYFEGFWDEALAAFKAAAENDQGGEEDEPDD
jgi:DNA-binding transcriptional ArsR family regulator